MASGKSPKTLQEIKEQLSASAKKVSRAVEHLSMAQRRARYLDEVYTKTMREHEDVCQKVELDAKKLSQNIAKKIGVEIEITDKQEGYVHCPDWIVDDEYEGDHFFCDWMEALQRVEWYKSQHPTEKFQ